MHEYEAIWLSAATEVPYAIPSYDETIEKLKRSAQSASQDSTLSQKTNEIQCLLSELRNASAEDVRQPTSTARPENPTSPRLHPDRVLSELQDLVERANRVKDEAIKPEAVLVSPQSTPTNPDASFASHNPRNNAPHAAIESQFHSSANVQQYYASNKVTPPLPKSFSQNAITPLQCSTSSAESMSSSASSSSLKQANSSSVPSQNRETKAPAFRPPPPYPAKFYVSLPSPTTNDPVQKQAQKPSVGSNTAVQTPVQRRSPPEYKAPPPVKRTTQVKENPQPTAPPRAKRQTGGSASAVSFPNGPPVPTRTSSTGLAPGIDVDAVAAVMAAAESTKAVPSTSGSSSPTSMANKALSKALGKFHATAASFKTKLAQFSDGKESEVPAPGNVDVMQRDANFSRPYGKNLIT